MADGFGVAGKLKQQGETLKFHIGVLGQDAIGVLILMEDILEEILRNQGQFQVSLVAGVVIQNVVDDIIGIEIIHFAFRVQGQGHCAGDSYRSGIAHIAVFIEGGLGIVGILQPKANLVLGLVHVSSLSSSSTSTITV